MKVVFVLNTATTAKSNFSSKWYPWSSTHNVRTQDGQATIDRRKTAVRSDGKPVASSLLQSCGRKDEMQFCFVAPATINQFVHLLLSASLPCRISKIQNSPGLSNVTRCEWISIRGRRACCLCETRGGEIKLLVRQRVKSTSYPPRRSSY